VLAELNDIKARLDALEQRGRRAGKQHDGPDGLSDNDRLLYEALVAWRLEESRRQDIGAFRVFSNRLLAEIARTRPAERFQLSEMKGVGSSKTLAYGDDVLAIVAAHTW